MKKKERLQEVLNKLKEGDPERENIEKQLGEEPLRQAIVRAARVKAYGTLVRASTMMGASAEKTVVTRAPDFSASGESGKESVMEQAEQGSQSKIEEFERTPEEGQNEELYSFPANIAKLALAKAKEK